MSVHEHWMMELENYKAKLKEQSGVSFNLPPLSLKETKIEFLEIKPGEKLVGKVPFQERFTNPIGTYQGGFLGAALDEFFGPLSYMTADRPCMTLSMNITFLKAFTAKMGFVTIEATVTSKTKSFIFMRAEVKSPEGELIAHSESHSSILRDDQMKKV